MQGSVSKEAAKRRGLLRFFSDRPGLAPLIAALALAVLPTATPLHAADPAPTRILLISVEGLGDDAGTLSAMPALRAAIAEGRRCERAFAPAPLGFPSLVALLAGRTPGTTGVRDEGSAGFPEGAALAPALARLGFRGLALPATLAAHRGTGIGRGFERFDPDSPALSDSSRVARALDWLAAPGRRFAWLGVALAAPSPAWRREDGARFADDADRSRRAARLDSAFAMLFRGLAHGRGRDPVLIAIAGTSGAANGPLDPRRVLVAFVGAGAGAIGGDASLADVAPTLVRAARGRPAGFDGVALLAAGAAPARPELAAAPERTECRAALDGMLPDLLARPDSAATVRAAELSARCPDDRRIAVEEAVARSRSGTEGIASRRFLELLQRWPDSAPIRIAYGDHLLRHQRWDLVTGAVAPIAPESPLAAEAEWQTALGLAGALRFAEAQQAIRRAASLAAPPGQPAESTLVTLRRLQEANAEADRKPKDVAVQLAYGRALGDFGIMEPAYQQFHRARGLAPASAEPDYWIAYYLLRTGRARPAISTLERALKTDSTHHASRLMLAETLIEQDRWRDAIPHLERALGQDPRDARSAFNLACLLARDGRADDAVRALERAVGAGYDDWAHLASDPDLAPLASHPGYQALLRRRPPGR